MKTTGFSIPSIACILSIISFLLGAVVPSNLDKSHESNGLSMELLLYRKYMDKFHYEGFQRTVNEGAQKCFDFQIVICNTYSKGPTISLRQSQLQGYQDTNQSRFLPPVNVCVKEAWKGFGWRLNKVHNYAKSMISVTRSSKCELIIISLDGNDVSVNGLSIPAVERRWLALETDILISTEMTCWVGHVCTNDEMKSFYSMQKSISPSPFSNSAFMGTVPAIVDVFNKACSHLYNCTDELDDQYAVTVLGAQQLNYTNYIIRRDTNQSIFGSMVYSQHRNSSCPKVDSLELRAACYDTRLDEYMQECCSNWDIPMETQLQMFQVVTHGHHRCDIVRLPGLQGSHDKREHFYTQAFLRLESIPLFWHGNGPGKKVYKELLRHVQNCKSEAGYV